MKKKKKTNILLYIVLILFVLVISLGFVFIKISLSPISDISEEKTVKIENNWYGKDVLKYLEEENVIRNSNVAYYYAKFKGIDLDFKAGTYNVDTSLSFVDLVSYLSNGNNAIQETVTIKFMEGSRVKDFAKEISDNTNLEYDDWNEVWQSNVGYWLFDTVEFKKVYTITIGIKEMLSDDEFYSYKWLSKYEKIKQKQI